MMQGQWNEEENFDEHEASECGSVEWRMLCVLVRLEEDVGRCKV
jgi:hypothetical protein